MRRNALHRDPADRRGRRGLPRLIGPGPILDRPLGVGILGVPEDLNRAARDEPGGVPGLQVRLDEERTGRRLLRGFVGMCGQLSGRRATRSTGDEPADRDRILEISSVDSRAIHRVHVSMTSNDPGSARRVVKGLANRALSPHLRGAGRWREAPARAVCDEPDPGRVPKEHDRRRDPAQAEHHRLALPDSRQAERIVPDRPGDFHGEEPTASESEPARLRCRERVTDEPRVG